MLLLIITTVIYLQDVHSVSSLLKMYFRELPNPLCTYYLYDKFVEAARSPENERLVLMREVVQLLPPPNYRSAPAMFFLVLLNQFALSLPHLKLQS